MKIQRKSAWLCAVMLACAIAAVAGAAEAPLTAQQQKMKTCNANAGDQKLKGDARAAFMKKCLSATPAPNSQQLKMKTCNADADVRSLKGDARKQFMSNCLKGSA